MFFFEINHNQMTASSMRDLKNSTKGRVHERVRNDYVVCLLVYEAKRMAEMITVLIEVVRECDLSDFVCDPPCKEKDAFFKSSIAFLRWSIIIEISFEDFARTNLIFMLRKGPIARNTICCKFLWERNVCCKLRNQDLRTSVVSQPRGYDEGFNQAAQ